MLQNGKVKKFMKFFLAVIVILQTTNASLTISEEEVTVGSSLRISGRDFSSNSPIWVFIEDKVVKISKSNEDGGFGVTIKVPELPCGYNSVWAIDNIGKVDGASFYVKPKIDISPKNARAGSNLKISGKGFYGNTDVMLKFDELMMKYIKTDEKGSFEINFEVPNFSPGYYLISVYDTKCEKTVFTDFEVLEPIATPTPTPTPKTPKTTPVQNELAKPSETKEIAPQTTPKILETKTTKSTPGFEAIIAIGGIATAILVSRRHR